MYGGRFALNMWYLMPNSKPFLCCDQLFVLFVNNSSELWLTFLIILKCSCQLFRPQEVTTINNDLIYLYYTCIF